MVSKRRPKGRLKTSVYVDLVDVPESGAKDRVLSALRNVLTVLAYEHGAGSGDK